MSRKTVRFARSVAALRRARGTDAPIDLLLPNQSAVIRGSGTTRMAQDKAMKRGAGNVCSVPMDPDKRRALIASL